MASVRSTTGCLACKTKRKKCDENKPQCLRCLASNTDCPGYLYVQNPNKPHRKLRTLPAPRTLVGRRRSKVQQAPVDDTEELQDQSSLAMGHDPITSGASSSALGADTGMLEDTDISNQFASSSSSSGSLKGCLSDSTSSHWLAASTSNLLPTQPPSAPLTSGQASLLEALFSLGQSSHVDLSPKRVQPTADPNATLVLLRPPYGAGKQNDPAWHGDENSKGAVHVIRPQLVLDRTTESNALPFVLQSYAAWMNRMALAPEELMRITRDFVISHFEDGVQSRWIITLVANIGSRVGTVELMEGRSDPLLSALQNAVRQRLRAVKSHPHSTRPTLIKALDHVVEAISIHSFVSPISEAMTLVYEAAPIFRQLCPEPPDAPINLPLLLKHPLRCLRHYAGMDVVFSTTIDIPTLFQYDFAILDNQPSDPYESVVAIEDDGILQWLYGNPNQLILVLAKMKSLRQSKSTPNEQMIGSLEQEIRGIQPYDGSSSERFLTIIRSVVQEVWRQTALVYLYMAVCGDSSDTPRVKGAFKRFIKLLHGMKPGRLPDEFLITNLILIAPAAQRKSDRETIRQRILGVYTRGRTIRENTIALYIIEDLWARVDVEERPTLWSDVTISKKRVLGP